MKRPIRTGAQAIRDAALLAAAILLILSVRLERAGEGLVPDAHAGTGDAIPAAVMIPASEPDPPEIEPAKAYRLVVSRAMRCRVAKT
jgi:hypothetical protein